MEIHSLKFILFYGLVAVGYFLLSGRWRWSLLLVVVEGLQAKGYNAEWLNARAGFIQFVFYLFALFLLLFLGNFQGSQPFIYAQF